MITYFSAETCNYIRKPKQCFINKFVLDWSTFAFDSWTETTLGKSHLRIMLPVLSYVAFERQFTQFCLFTVHLKHRTQSLSLLTPGVATWRPPPTIARDRLPSEHRSLFVGKENIRCRRRISSRMRFTKTLGVGLQCLRGYEILHRINVSE